jgi:hypothetical protein
MKLDYSSAWEKIDLFVGPQLSSGSPLLTEGNFVALCRYYNSTKLPTPP